MVRFIILLVILILVLSYFGISIRHVAESPTGADNFAFVWNYIQDGWAILVGWIAAALSAIMRVFAH